MSVISTHEVTDGIVTGVWGDSLVVAEVEREDVDIADEAGTEDIVVQQTKMKRNKSNKMKACVGISKLKNHTNKSRIWYLTNKITIATI